MKVSVIATAAVAALLLAGSAYADVPAGTQQEGVTLFEQMDQDGDGVVSQGEFEEYSLEEGDKTQLFGVIDQNADGSISESEWRAYEAGETGAAAEQPMATEEPMTTEEPVQEKRRSTGDVWDEQTYDVNDPRKIEPEDKSMAE
jgi:hypothetical protein